MAHFHATFEEDVQINLSNDHALHNLVSKDYPLLQKDKELLYKKKKEFETIKSKCEKESKTADREKEQK